MLEKKKRQVLPIHYLCNGVDSHKGQHISTRDNARTLFLQHLLNLIHNLYVANAEVDGRLLLPSPLAGVQQQGGIAPLHEAVVEEQAKQRGGSGLIDLRVLVNHSLHHRPQLRALLLVVVELQRGCQVSSHILQPQVPVLPRHKVVVPQNSTHLLLLLQQHGKQQQQQHPPQLPIPGTLTQYYHCPHFDFYNYPT